MSKKYTELWYRELDGETFFKPRKRKFDDTGKTEKLAPCIDPEFKALPQYIQREIWAGKYGLTWELYSAIPAKDRVNLNLSTIGISSMSTAEEMLDASEKDVRAATVSGALGALKFGSTALLWFGIGFALFFLRAPILRAIKKVKAGAA
ncbi:MAG: hypothetical protein JXR40_03915 [Pontiellaceae bacterium]|nr:hypothetical protein [Pontiellaceae bacterium]